MGGGGKDNAGGALTVAVRDTGGAGVIWDKSQPSSLFYGVKYGRRGSLPRV